MTWLWFLLVLAVTEIPYDGIDQDGDGVDLVDADRDGFPSTLALGLDCNDRDSTVNPWAWDARGDGVDSDCDGLDGMAQGASVGQVWVRGRRLASVGVAAPIGSWLLWFLLGRSRRASTWNSSRR